MLEWLQSSTFTFARGTGISKTIIAEKYFRMMKDTPFEIVGYSDFHDTATEMGMIIEVAVLNSNVQHFAWNDKIPTVTDKVVKDFYIVLMANMASRHQSVTPKTGQKTKAKMPNEADMDVLLDVTISPNQFNHCIEQITLKSDFISCNKVELAATKVLVVDDENCASGMVLVFQNDQFLNIAATEIPVNKKIKLITFAVAKIAPNFTVTEVTFV